MDEYSREPCPWRILSDSGGSFVTGAIGGGIFQSIKGFRNAPVGFSRKMLGSLATIKEKAPKTAGRFGVWGCMFSTIDCSLGHVRQHDDPWNSIMSGALTGGILSARNGVPAIAAGALVGGIVMSIIEAVVFMNIRLEADISLEDPSFVSPSQFQGSSLE